MDKKGSKKLDKIQLKTVLEEKRNQLDDYR